MKDVCLLPDLEWKNVPRRSIKEVLVKHNMYVDALRFDKSWSEEFLRSEIHALSTD